MANAAEAFQARRTKALVGARLNMTNDERKKKLDVLGEPFLDGRHATARLLCLENVSEPHRREDGGKVLKRAMIHG